MIYPSKHINDALPPAVIVLINNAHSVPYGGQRSIATYPP